MTTTPKPPTPTPQEVASRLLNKVESWGQHWDKWLTPESDVLVADTWGLLNGMSLGHVTTGNDRIHHNLVKLASNLAKTCKDKNEMEKITGELHSVTTQTSGFGLAVSGQDLSGRNVARIRS